MNRLRQGDGGIDIEGNIIDIEHEVPVISLVIQCKNWANNVGVTVVRDMEGKYK